MPKILDLSTTLATFGFDPRPPQIVYWEHRENARYYCRSSNVPLSAFPDQMALAVEEVHAITHTGTHLDAPWHFGPTAEGKPAKTIDEVPLEWCFGDGVLLDFRHKKTGEVITKDDLEAELDRIAYTIKPGNIPLIMVLGGDLYLKDHNYPSLGAGLDGEAVLWLLDEGVKVMGTDAWSLDVPLSIMARSIGKAARAHLACAFCRQDSGVLPHRETGQSGPTTCAFRLQGCLFPCENSQSQCCLVQSCGDPED